MACGLYGFHQPLQRYVSTSCASTTQRTQPALGMLISLYSIELASSRASTHAGGLAVLWVKYTDPQKGSSLPILVPTHIQDDNLKEKKKKKNR